MMFNEKEISAYRSIKAPEDLLGKITSPKKKPQKALRYISAVAACFLFLIISSLVINNNQTTIIINGQELTDSVVFYDTASAAGRALSSSVSVPVEIKATTETKVSVSDGFISINGSPPEKEITIASAEVIWWEIVPDETECIFEMRISDKKAAKKVTLEYNNSKITATKENEK